MTPVTETQLVLLNEELHEWRNAGTAILLHARRAGAGLESSQTLANICITRINKVMENRLVAFRREHGTGVR